MITQIQKELILRLLEALYPGVKVYLFGSRARGTHRLNSDIDLALDAGRELTFVEIARARKVIEALNIPEKVDVVDLCSVNKDFKEIILKEGILWN